MAENIIKPGELAEKALEKTQEGFTSGDQPEEEDVGRFAQLLSGSNEEAVEATNNADQVAQPALTLGDKVLQGMQGLRDHVEAKTQLVKTQLEPGEAMSMKEMFRTQMAMTNLMITEDYIGKIVSKSTQTFDTLLRNQ